MKYGYDTLSLLNWDAWSDGNGRMDSSPGHCFVVEGTLTMCAWFRKREVNFKGACNAKIDVNLKTQLK